MATSKQIANKVASTKKALHKLEASWKKAVSAEKKKMAAAKKAAASKKKKSAKKKRR